MSPTETTRYGTPVILRRPGKPDLRGTFVRAMPDGRIGVSTHSGYGYFDADRVEICETPKPIRRR